MKTAEKHTVFFLLILSLVSIYSKCAKDLPLPACSGNCSDIVFSGNVMDVVTGLPIRNAQIKITTPGDYGTIDTVYVLGVVGSNANGNFNLSKSIDTSIHKLYSVEAIMPEGYLISPQTTDDYSIDPSNIQLQYFNAADPGIHNIQFSAFSPSRLAINLHRNSPLPAAGLTMEFDYSIHTPGVYQVYGNSSWFQASVRNIDTVIYIETAPNLNTVINWNGTSYINTLSQGADSITCQSNVANQISITY